MQLGDVMGHAAVAHVSKELAVQAREISVAACGRYVAFLRDELEQIPSWHPMHLEYRLQLTYLDRRLTRLLRRRVLPEADLSSVA